MRTLTPFAFEHFARSAFLLTIVLLLALPTWAQKAEDDYHLIAPHQEQLVLTYDYLLANDGIPSPSPIWSPDPITATSPSHGVLLDTGSELLYSPNADFWSLGFDSFTYTLHTPEVSGSTTATVFLTAGRHGERTSFEDFEGPTVGDCWQTFGNIQVDPGAAISGGFGATVDPAGDAFFRCWLPITPPGTPLPLPFRGNGQQGSGSGMTLRPPKGSGGGGTGSGGGGGGGGTITGDPVPLQDFLLFSATEEGVGSAVDLELRTNLTTSWVRATAFDEFNVAHSTAWAEVPNVATHVGVDWWPSDTQTDGGLILWVDGLHAGQLEGLSDFDQATTVYDFGLPQSTAGLAEALSIDDLEIWQGVFSHGDQQVAFADDFEDGLNPIWIGARSSFVVVNSQAALTGSLGLQAVLGQDKGVLIDPSPSADDHYNVKFSFDFDAAHTGPSGVVLLEGLEDPTKLSDSVFSMEAANTVKGAQLWITADRDEDAKPSGPAATDRMSITPGPHTVEVQWRAASGPLAKNGFFRLWLDGERVLELTDLDNHTLELDAIRLGALDPAGVSSGHVKIDDYATWN